MKDIFDQTAYPDLPTPVNADGQRRRIGIEVEFGGIDAKTAACAFADATGGALSAKDHVWFCETAEFGCCRFYLDTRYQNDLLAFGGETALDVARRVVPVELVSDPFDPAKLPQFDRALNALRAKGATGTQDSMAHGFGTHLNVEIANPGVDHIWRVSTAFALLEPLLREVIDIDVSRRILPFVNPFPVDVVSALVDSTAATPKDFARDFLSETSSRNHGLDLMPVLTWLAPACVAHALPEDEKNTARPAYHYRLPESRIGDAHWGIARDWRIWVALEHVAERDDILDALRAAWRKWEAGLHISRASWVHQAREVVAGHAIGEVFS